MNGETVTTRLPKQLVKELEVTAEMEHLGKSEIVRRLLIEGLEQWRIQKALELYTKGKFSFGQAAKFAKVSVWRFSDLMKEHKVQLNYDLEDLKQDLEAIKSW